jgi:nucleotide-binding universal stress UspA family protein
MTRNDPRPEPRAARRPHVNRRGISVGVIRVGREERACWAPGLTKSRDHAGGEPSRYGRPMASSILLCTDGSDEALGALSAGLDLLGPDHEFVLVTVSDAPDEGSLAGSGHAGPELSLKEYDDQVAQAGQVAKAAVGKAQSELALVGGEIHVLRGDPGAAICQLATELSARAIVIGSRGRGGLKRAFLGSVSDHVVRNAPCSVVVTRV